MSFVTWTEDLSVGVAEIDAQHQQFIASINKLQEVISQKSRENIETLFADLEYYSNVHFETEEKYMVRFGFPGYEEHRSEHVHFRNIVLNFKRMYDSGVDLYGTEMLTFLKGWLSTHLKGLDQQYVRCFRENGLK